MKRTFLSLTTSFVVFAVAQAEVKLPGWMTSNMVLQQQTTMHLTATAKKGATVKITGSWDDQTVKVRADKQSGAFNFDLRVPAAGGPYTLTFDDGQKLVLNNVMAGEVWFCSGQSNMEMPVKGWGKVMNWEQEVASANHPLVRLFQVKKVVAITPQTDVPLGHTNGWTECTPAMVEEFSAAAYFFAREVSQQLGVAVGVVNSSWGGTPAESWVSLETLQGVTGFETHAKRLFETGFDKEKVNQLYQEERAEWTKNAIGVEPKAPTGPWYPAGLYNSMVAPFLDMPVRGFLWYQGCSNVGRAMQYESLFKALIHDWQTRFNKKADVPAEAQSPLPFYFVQLANYLKRQELQPQSGWAALREAQRKALQLDGVGMAVNIDIGMANDIHPKNKQEVGRRLALLALNRTYSRDVVCAAPEYEQMLVRNGQAILTFRPVPGSAPLAENDDIKGFTVAGPDHQWHVAKAHTASGHIVVECPEVALPVAVRYAWADNPECNLVTTAGLPVGPFRTDDW